MYPFKAMVTHWSWLKTLILGTENFQCPVLELRLCSTSAQLPSTTPSAFGHRAVGSGRQVAGKKSTTSRREMCRLIIKKPSKHTLAQVFVKEVRANTSCCVSAAFDRALIGNFHSALTLFYQVPVCRRFF